GARAEQAVIVVDEPHEPVVDTLVIRNVCVGGVNADRLADDLGEGPLRAHEIVEDLAGPDLIAGEDALLELGVQRGILRDHGHGSDPPSLPGHYHGGGVPAGRGVPATFSTIETSV